MMTITKTRSNSCYFRPPVGSAIVVSTIGTAPRRPAQDTNASLRQRQRLHDRAEDPNRERSGDEGEDQSRQPPRGRAVENVIRPGEKSSPSITNSPIWASHAIPSANDRVAPRCGNSLLPRIRAAT